ncbi:MAG: insulinase family protein [Cryomorphaceae bacterium]|nr:insulinase family protein [Cryomorphaceae bacterium]
MKKLIAIALGALFTTTMNAQLDRSKMPEPGPAREIKLGKYRTFTLRNGLTVIVVEDKKLPRVTMNLLVNRDPIFEGEKAGYVEITGELLRRGTTNRPKDDLNEVIDFMGANVSTNSTGINASGLSKYAESLMEIVADIAINPALPKEDFENILLNMRSGLESEKDSPDGLMRRLRAAVMYGLDHPYGESETLESLDNITLEDCKKYYETFFKPNISYLAVVGNVRYRDVKKWARKHFRDWERNEVPEQKFDAPYTPEELSVAIINRSSSVQSKIAVGNTIDLKPGDDHVIPMRLANQILGGGSQGRLFQNLREDKAYTYGSYSSYSTDKLIGNFSASADVRNNVTDSAIMEILAEINTLRNESVDAETLQNVKNYLSGTFGMSLERPQTLARFALDIERYNLPKKYYADYLKKLNAVTADEIKLAANKYMRPENGYIFVVGKDSEIGDKLKRFGKVNYFDNEGKRTERPSIPIPDGLTAKKVISNYLKAIGADQTGKIKDFKMQLVAELPQGRGDLAVNIKKKAGADANLFLEELTVAGNQMTKKVFNGKKATETQMGNTRELDKAEAAEMMLEAEFFPERSYEAANYQLKLAGAELFKGKIVYIVEITTPSGSKITEYYDAETGYKVKVSQTFDTPQGEMTQGTQYSDYRKVGDFLFPHRMIQNIMGQEFIFDAKVMEINTGLQNSDFK